MKENEFSMNVLSNFACIAVKACLNYDRMKASFEKHFLSSQDSLSTLFGFTDTCTVEERAFEEPHFTKNGQ